MLYKLISFFKNFYKAETKQTKILDGIYFHEDFYCQVEFCPRENLEFLRNENKEISNFSKEHSDGNGLYTDIYVREKNNEKSIIENQILLTELDFTLSSLGLDKIENVYSGYGSYVEKCKNTIAYKFDSAEIFVFSEKDFVKDFFINGFRFHEIEEIKYRLEEILYKIGTEYNLILNDWDLTEIIDLNDRSKIKKYLNEEL